MLAACCDAFRVDLRQYWAFIENGDLPCLAPRPCPDQVRTWEDWAPWNGVELQEAAMGTRKGSASNTDNDNDDPLPFGPILPDEMPSTLELASREDPLAEILKKTALDSVLERYWIWIDVRYKPVVPDRAKLIMHF